MPVVLMAVSATVAPDMPCNDCMNRPNMCGRVDHRPVQITAACASALSPVQQCRLRLTPFHPAALQPGRLPWPALPHAGTRRRARSCKWQRQGNAHALSHRPPHPLGQRAGQALRQYAPRLGAVTHIVTKPCATQPKIGVSCGQLLQPAQQQLHSSAGPQVSTTRPTPTCWTLPVGPAMQTT